MKNRVKAVTQSARAVIGATGFGTAIEGFEVGDGACLTYDDGPDPEGTVAVLTELAERGAKATFFVMANRVRRYPSILHEVVSEGHEIALHGLDHRDLSHYSAAKVRSFTKEATATVEDELGQGITWFRPPYIALRADGWIGLRGLDLRFVAARSAIKDWDPDIDDRTRIEMLRETLRPGDVILAHDSWAGPEDNAHDGPEPVVDRARLTREALDLLAERELTPLTLSQAHSQGGTDRSIRVAFKPTVRP